MQNVSPVISLVAAQAERRETYVGARESRHRATRSPSRSHINCTSPASRGSGVAAPRSIDKNPVDGVAGLARAYLIGWDQFEDVVAQENGRPSASIDIDAHDLVPGFSRQIGPGRYENLLCPGRLNDMPVVTFTAPWSMSEVTPGPPSVGYLAILITGLREAHDLSDKELTSYLGSAPGCFPDAVTDALKLVPRGGGEDLNLRPSIYDLGRPSDS